MKKKEVVNIDSIYEIKSRVLKSPQETLTRSMTPPNGSKKVFSILWRPNNYRRQIRVKTKTGSTIHHLQKVFNIWKVEEKGCSPQNNSTMYSPHISKTPIFKLCGQNKVITIKNYKGITIQYGRNNLVGIFSQNIILGNKETYLIDADSMGEVEERLQQKKEEIRKLIDDTLFGFINEFDIGIPYMIPIWSRHEDWIKGEDYIDKLPREVIIHDTVFKKVYGEGIEFIGGKDKEPVAHMKNYIKNRAVEDVVPELVNRLNTLEVGFIEKAGIIEKQIGILALAQINTQKQFKQLIQVLKPPREKKVRLERPSYFG